MRVSLERAGTSKNFIAPLRWIKGRSLTLPMLELSILSSAREWATCRDLIWFAGAQLSTSVVIPPSQRLGLS
jgi:hypothetical protein